MVSEQMQLPQERKFPKFLNQLNLSNKVVFLVTSLAYLPGKQRIRIELTIISSSYLYELTYNV